MTRRTAIQSWLVVGLLLVLPLPRSVVVAQASAVTTSCVTADGRENTVVPVNDNYCDCPSTGMDEPHTSACAGSRHWPGNTYYVSAAAAAAGAEQEER